MAWIESHQSLGSHPKTIKLARLLGVSKIEAVGHLHFLWWWSMDYAQDGDLDKFDDVDISIGAEWGGEASDFVDALVTVGFLERDGNVLKIHDWYDYAGKLIDRRAKNAARMRDARASTEEERATHVQRTLQTRVGLPNQPNQTKPTSTKRTRKTDDNYSPGFIRFWAEYPKKESKDSAWRAWQAIDPSDQTVDAMLNTIAWQRGTSQWSKEGGQFIPLPATWLNSGKWKDEPVSVTGPKKGAFS
jgi:hypothetical protein